MDAPHIEALARELSTTAREHAEETERRRALAPELLAALRESGLLRAGAPREVGGLELDPGTALTCAEEIAKGDASAGWCVSIAVTSSLLAAYLPEAARRELFGDGTEVAAGVWAPGGQARSANGGCDYKVSGRWGFCSGIAHSDMLFAGCIVEGSEDPRPRVAALAKQDLGILDTWHTLGLRGTGSSDTTADDVRVPQARVFSLFDGPRIDRPLYRFPIFGFFALSIAAAALGNARSAIDDLIELASTKRSLGSSRSLAQRAPTQARVAAAEASLNAARALYYGSIETAWREAQKTSDPPSTGARMGLRQAATHAVRTSADVTREMYDLAGGSAIYDGSPLQRRFRDAYTATAHFQVNEASRELPGRLLLGQPTDPAML